MLMALNLYTLSDLLLEDVKEAKRNHPRWDAGMGDTKPAKKSCTTAVVSAKKGSQAPVALEVRRSDDAGTCDANTADHSEFSTVPSSLVRRPASGVPSCSFTP